MTAPSKTLRALVYARDSGRCASCGTSEAKTFQHRAATGMGGAGRKAVPLNAADGLTLCGLCNEGAEHAGQSRALALGWKLLRHRQLLACQIPFYVQWAGEWWLPDVVGGKTVIREALALELVAVGRGNRD